MGGHRIRVFHLSDLHMRSGDGPQKERVHLEAASRWRVLGEKWTANLAELRRDGVPFDLVVFTGDLGDWGHPTDYPGAIAFLKETCAALLVRLLDRHFPLPRHPVPCSSESWTRPGPRSAPTRTAPAPAGQRAGLPEPGLQKRTRARALWWLMLSLVVAGVFALLVLG